MKKIISLFLINVIFSAGIQALAPIAHAQIQEAIQEIAASDITIEVLSDFEIGPVFFSPNEQTVQKIFALNTPGQQISVTDLRANGDFSVDATVSDLSSGTDVIPHENIKILSLTESPETSVDIFPSDAPGDVTGPLDFNWDFTSPIPESAFTQIYDSGSEISEPILVIDGISPGAVRVGQYSVTPAFQFTLPAALPEGNYTGIITITLNA